MFSSYSYERIAIFEHNFYFPVNLFFLGTNILPVCPLSITERETLGFLKVGRKNVCLMSANTILKCSRLIGIYHVKTNKQTNNHQPGTVVVPDTGDLNFATTKPETNW